MAPVAFGASSRARSALPGENKRIKEWGNNAYMKKKISESRGDHRRWLIRSPEFGSAVDLGMDCAIDSAGEHEQKFRESDEGFEGGSLGCARLEEIVGGGVGARRDRFGA